MLGGDCCGAVGSSKGLKGDGRGFGEDGGKAIGGRDCGDAGCDGGGRVND